MADDGAELKPGELTARGRAQRRLIGFIIVLAVVGIAYRLVYATGLSRTAALYVGVPALLAIGLTLLPRSRSATGMIFKGATLAMLIACVVLPEGLLCLLFAVPLVGVISLLVGLPIDAARRVRRREGPTLMAVAAPLLLMSLEGVVGSPFDDRGAASASVTVEASAHEVEAALAMAPDFDVDLPAFLEFGFNRPATAHGTGLDVGDVRVVDFTGGTHDDHPLRVFGLTGERSVDHHSEMHLTVSEARPGRVVFSVDHDETMLARWAELDRAVVTWSAIDAQHTRVTLRLEYRRLLYPTAYFSPLQRYGMGQAADYLLDAAVQSHLR